MRSSRSVPGLGVSPLWLLEKAKNHTGYGYDGRVNPGEVQCTAVSGDTPESWRQKGWHKWAVLEFIVFVWTVDSMCAPK